jgi:hypothetical protein
MKKYRQLFEGQDTLRVGDQYALASEDLQSGIWLSFTRGNDAPKFVKGVIYRREVPAHNWISFEERKPTEADANSCGVILALDPTSGGESDPYFARWNYEFCTSTHWIPLNFVEETRPVKVDGKTLLPMKDGSVKISCGTTIPKEDVEEFLRQRNEVMK